MPSYEEFPVPGQNEFRARRGETTDADHPERRRLTLLQRLAAVGLGRREDEEDARPVARPAEPARAPERHAQRQSPPQSQRPAPRGTDPRGSEPVSEYGKRTTPHGLDSHGRAAPIHPSSEDDQLDIPAFLRRQANWFGVFEILVRSRRTKVGIASPLCASHSEPPGVMASSG
jgi:cell division protein FtsZ